MYTIVHLETVVRSVFGVVDDNGNVVQQVVVGGSENQPIVLKALTQENWTGIYNSLMDAKHQVLERANKEGPEEEIPVVEGIVD